jgi:hypothetical protein
MLCANRSEIVSALFSEGYGKDYMKKYSVLSGLSISNAQKKLMILTDGCLKCKDPMKM